MASFFGEVAALSSRADFDDDENENEEVQHVLFTEFNGTPADQKKSSNIMLFSVGAIASAFVKNYFLPSVDAQPVAIINYKSNIQNSDFDAASNLGLNYARHPKSNVLASMYLAKNDVLLCDVPDSIPDELNIDLCDEILNNFPANEAVILTTYHKATYKSTTSTDQSFLKALATSKFSEIHRCGISFLPLPNIVTKFPAAVLTEFEVKGKIAVAFINYIETMSVDSLNIKAFESVLRETIITKNVSVNADADARLKCYLKSKRSSQSNLYI